MADYIHDISSLIPQAPPFIMVDTLLFSDEKTARTTFRIQADNVLVENGAFSAAGLMENIAQTAAAGMGSIAAVTGQPVSPGYIASVKNLEIAVLPQVGDQLITEITIEARVLDIVVISGTITCKGVVIATGEMKILISV
jgi:predicted hotdog family 3-hydroxylacyl-ACP dehydratase